MNAEYRKELTKNYLVLEDTGNFSYEDYQVRMLTRNRIPGFLDCQARMLDGRLSFYYDTMDCRPLVTVYSGRPVGRADMETLLRAAASAMKSAGEYLLRPSGVLLEPEYIFQSADGKFLFCYLPGRTATFAEAFNGLSEYLLSHLNYGEKEGVVLGYGIYKKAQEEYACMESLLAMLSEPETGLEFQKEPEMRDLYGEKEADTGEANEEKEDSLESQYVAGSGGRKQGKYGAGKEKRDRKQKKKEIRKKEEISLKSRDNRKRYLKAAAGGVLFLLAGAYVLYRRGIWEVFPSETGQIVIEAGNRAAEEGFSWEWFFLPGGIIVLLTAFFLFILLKRRKARNRETMENSQEKSAWVKEKRGEKEWSEKDWLEEGGQYFSMQEFQKEPEVLSPTVYLGGGEPEIQRKLINMDNQEEIFLKGEIFRIGKARGMVELCLAEATVSRLHARLSKENSDWYIQDLNSTNGTYLNGRRIKASEKLLLSQGDEIRLADVEFLFL